MAQAKWNLEDEDADEDGDAGVSAHHRDRFSRAGRSEAKERARNNKKDCKREKGGGSVVINGSALAKPGAICIISGARPGIDGPWRIEQVSHSFSRSGWTTSLSFKMPGKKKDSRTDEDDDDE